VFIIANLDSRTLVNHVHFRYFPFLSHIQSAMIFNQGASFQGRISTIGGLSFGVLLVITLAALEGQESVAINLLNLLPFTLPGMVICFSLLLKVEGVEVDLEKKRIRTFNKYFYFKFGNWVSLNEFNRITLKIDRFTYRSGPTMIANSRYKQNFDVAIMNKDSGNSIHLEECMSYREGKVRLAYFGTLFNLEIWDQVSIDLDHAQMRRKR